MIWDSWPNYWRITLPLYGERLADEVQRLEDENAHLREVIMRLLEAE